MFIKGRGTEHLTCSGKIIVKRGWKGHVWIGGFKWDMKTYMLRAPKIIFKKQIFLGEKENLLDKFGIYII